MVKAIVCNTMIKGSIPFQVSKWHCGVKAAASDLKSLEEIRTSSSLVSATNVEN